MTAAKHGQGRSWWRWPVLIALVAAGILISLLSPAGRHQWALSLARQPTQYTTLYFNRAAGLPEIAGQASPVNVTFTIENHEGRAIEYVYRITVSDGARARLLLEASKKIAEGVRWEVSAAIRPGCGRSPCRVQVSLPGFPEKIFFRLAPSALGK